MGWLVLPEMDLREYDLRGWNVSYIDFRQVALDAANLQGASIQDCGFGDLHGVCFDQTTLRDGMIGQLRECSATDSHWTGAITDDLWEDCDFSRSDVSGLHLNWGVRRIDCTFQETKFRNIGEEAIFEKCDLTGADLQQGYALRTVFRQCQMERMNFSGGDCRGVRFEKCDLTQAAFSGALLGGAKFLDCELDRADFQHANVLEAELDGSNVIAARHLSLEKTIAPSLGAAVRELSDAAEQAEEISMFVQAELPHDHVRMWLTSKRRGAEFEYSSTNRHSSHGAMYQSESTLGEAFRAQVRQWGHAELDVASLTIRLKKASAPRRELRLLAARAWAEAWGLTPPSHEEFSELEKQREQRQRQRGAALVQELREAEGDHRKLKFRDDQLKELDHLREQDFSRMEFQEDIVWGPREGTLDFRRSCFDDCRFQQFRGVRLRLQDATFQRAAWEQSRLAECEADRCDFADGVFHDFRFGEMKLAKASFVGAKMREVVFADCDLRGADFTGAVWEDVSFKECQFDERTQFPDDQEKPSHD